MTDKDIIQKIENHEPATFEQIKRTPFQTVVDLVLKTLSETSQRVYGQTYDAWVVWCKSAGVHPVDVNVPNVEAFLLDQDTTKSTRQRHLSALRKFAEIIAILDGEPARTNYRLLKMYKVPSRGKKTEQKISAERERSKRALSPAEADALLRVWQDGSLTSRRNAAMISLLLATGLRRAELAALQWRDIDLAAGMVYVRSGKGDKSREVPVMTDYALEALKAWQRTQTAAGDTERLFVFCSVGKGNRLLEDAPTHTDTVWRVVKSTGKRAGVKWSPHDGRRTVITEIAESAGVKAAQQVAGHAFESTTLGYVGRLEAQEIKRRANLRYGAVTAHDQHLFTDAPLFDNAGGDGSRWTCRNCGQTAFTSPDNTPCPYCGSIDWKPA